ncbi:MAG: haloacid dehalogenase-like hydrolase [Lachnospiraceae bacterium]|nr:haloacid dehalogenase-like hydrolase [Lachnospiraceae bacterium]
MKKSKGVLALMLAVLVLIGCVRVPERTMAALKLSQTEAVMTVGDTLELSVTGTKKKVKWISSDPETASVDTQGVVRAVKEGDAVITARTGKKKLKCFVTVVPLPLSGFWTADSAPAESLREYVAKVTDETDEGFIPVRDRIAVFDMDGTLTCETFYTYYDTMMFIEFCLKDHPERVSEELKEAAREIKPGYTAGEELARNFARAYKGMTIDELYDYAVEFGQKKTESFENMRYIDGFYLPMVEVVEFLYENGFTIYVVSGTERTTSRAIVANSPISEYVSPAHVIGTEFEVKQKGNEETASNMDYKYADGDELVFTGGFIQKNLNANKSIWIEREIGQRPVLAFGNSGSDTSMMNYCLDHRNPYPSQAYMVVADDGEREWGKQDWTQKSEEYLAMGYVPVSMKNDFAEIYPEGIKPAEKQYTEPEEALLNAA